MAVEPLDSLQGDADQHFVMIVGIVGVSAEMRVHALDPGFLIAANPDPIVVGRFSGA